MFDYLFENQASIIGWAINKECRRQRLHKEDAFVRKEYETVQ